MMPTMKVARAAYGMTTPKRIFKSNAPTPIQGIKTTTSTAKDENTRLSTKFIDDYLFSEIEKLSLYSPFRFQGYYSGIS